MNGPSILRIARTLLLGWRTHKDHPEARVRERYGRECAGLSTVYSGALWAAQRWFRGSPVLAGRIGATRRALVREFGLVAALAGPLVGTFLLAAMRREARRLGLGTTYEPPTSYETNRSEQASGRRPVSPCRWISPPPAAASSRCRSRPCIPGRPAR